MAMMNKVTISSYFVENPKFDKVENVRCLEIMTSLDCRNLWKSWNISIHHWLKNYVYLRWVSRQRKNSLTPVMLTFLVSAIWHGFYPGYLVIQFFDLLAILLLRSYLQLYSRSYFKDEGALCLVASDIRSHDSLVRI